MSTKAEDAMFESDPQPRILRVLHVEVRQTKHSIMRPETVEAYLRPLLAAEDGFSVPSEYTTWRQHGSLAPNVARVQIAELSRAADGAGPAIDPFSAAWLPAADAVLSVHVYACTEADEDPHYAGEGEDEVMASNETFLPVGKWEGLWESLLYPDDIKTRLLDYIYTTIVYSEAGVDQHIVTWNRMVLLHGPPGGGKTSLAHALAQKLAIRMSKRYTTARMLEINSHSLFSKWFSESGKLVQKLFDHIASVLEDEDTFVTVLIDEVESLTAARAGAVAGNEPSDALRVVNALLTQLDKLKRHKNVLVIATSNLPDAIDPAFVDRADIVQFVGLPPPPAVYAIVRSCLLEIMRAGLVQPAPIPDAAEARLEPAPLNRRLLDIAQACHAQGMSGRALRRLPVLAHMQCLDLAATPLARSGADAGARPRLSVEQWLGAMERMIAQQAVQRAHAAGPVVKTEPI